jgi:hypothetical protein
MNPVAAPGQGNRRGFQFGQPGVMINAAVIYGTVLGVEPVSKDASKPITPDVSRLDVRVEATLAGSVAGPAKTPRLTLEFLPGFMLDRDPGVVGPVPPPGSHVLALVIAFDHPANISGEVTVGVPFTPPLFVSFLPHESAIARVSGFDDPKVGAVIAKLREDPPFTNEVPARQPPRTFVGNEPGLWDEHSLVYGEVMLADTWRRLVPAINFNVKATLCGPLDASHVQHFGCNVMYQGWVPPIKPVPSQFSWLLALRPAVKSLPPTGSRVLAVVRRTKDCGVVISQDQFLFMPDKSPLAAVSGLDDTKVKEVISRLQELRKRAGR